ncbi:hypothetical protein [Jeotgalibacillus campisalis]|uniref:Uncharacterized protein n=1 Tax=Jeotgalibacillus campisalis TaxID=220754 RepID=A0A0C2SGJ2_9BACL|nr:hypothetical protein [Jeotgalibacillus campisalis]KIL53034.1 hypothetical protein KR50_03630 [Jeotgalibacillus campisalis]
MKHLEKPSSFFYKTVNGVVLLVSVAVFALFIAVVLPAESEKSQQATGSSRSPDTALLYSAEELYSIADEYGDEGRSAYVRSRFSFDIIWPLVYAFFLTSASTFFMSSVSSVRLKTLNLLPAAGMLFDFLENIAASIVMIRYPSLTPGIAQLTPVFTLFKWLCIYASFGLLAISFGYWVFQLLKSFLKRDAR